MLSSSAPDVAFPWLCLIQTLLFYSYHYKTRPSVHAPLLRYLQHSNKMLCAQSVVQHKDILTALMASVSSQQGLTWLLDVGTYAAQYFESKM